MTSQGRDQEKPVSSRAEQTDLVGWSCSYTPEELLMAAGLTPSRIPTWQAAGLEGESQLSAMLCPYVHRMYQLGAGGGLKDFRGLVLAYSCDSMRRLADVCESRLHLGFVYRLDVPRRFDSQAEAFFVSRLEQLKHFLEAETGRTITDSDIMEAVQVVNRTRLLLQELAALRAQSPELVGATDYQSACRQAQSGDKRTVNQRLAEWIERLRTDHAADGAGDTSRPRVMVWGCPVEDGELFRVIEEAGGLLAADDLCTTTRHFQGVVETTGQPVRDLARFALRRPSCSRMCGAGQRIERVYHTIRAAGCDGLICHSLKFCDLTQSDMPRLRQSLENKSIPVLQLERQGLGEESGQLRTRVEAFLEMLRKRRAKAA